MEMNAMGIAIIAGGAIIGFLVTYLVGKKTAAKAVAEADAKAQSLINDASKEATSIKKEKLLEAKEEIARERRKAEQDRDAKDAKLRGLQKEITKREEGVNERFETISKKEKQLAQKESELGALSAQIDKKRSSIDALVEEQNDRLERITGMSKEDAKRFLMENLVNDAKAEAAQSIKDVRDEAKVSARKEAQRIVLMAIQRTASDHCVESTVSVVNISNDEMKGRIIGKEGRNIRAFEAATGIDLIIDDTPEAVVISGFDAFRREVARVSLERLMGDGRSKKNSKKRSSALGRGLSWSLGSTTSTRSLSGTSDG